MVRTSCDGLRHDLDLDAEPPEGVQDRDHDVGPLLLGDEVTIGSTHALKVDAKAYHYAED